MSNIKVYKKFYREGDPFWDTMYFYVILLETGLVTNWKHRFIIMWWKIFVCLMQSMLMFNASIITFLWLVPCFLSFFKSYWFIYDFCYFAQKQSSKTHIGQHILFQTNKTHWRMNHSLFTHNEWNFNLATWQLKGRY